jgi:hypothetical protein
MARNYVEAALLTIAIKGGAKKRVTCVKSFSPKLDDPSNPVKTMTSERRALGYTRGVPDFGGSLSCYVPKATEREFNWRQMMLDGTLFTASWLEGRDDDSDQSMLIDCRITSVSPKYDEGGETMEDVEFTALNYKTGPAA